MAETGSDHIQIAVKNQEGDTIQFKIKRTTKLGKVVAAYHSKKGAAQGTFRLLYEGNVVKEDDTPDKLEMEEGDVIMAMVEQVGGAL